MISKFLRNTVHNDFKNVIYNNYNSFIKDNILKTNQIQKRDKKTKSYISLINNEAKNLSLIKIKSEKNVHYPDKDLIESNNIIKYNKENYKNKFLSKNNVNLKKEYNKKDSKVLYNILNKNNSKDNILIGNNLKNFLNLKNISNINDSITLLNENTKNNETMRGDKNIFTILKGKISEEKNFINSQSNIYKIEYVKKLIRKYYFENFENLKEYYNFINNNNKDYLTIEDFCHLLKEIIKINNNKKEIKDLLNTNGIIKVNYISFKQIFFPEQTNNKTLNLKLQNEKKDNLSKTIIKNNYSYVRINLPTNDFRKKFPSIGKKLSSFNKYNINYLNKFSQKFQCISNLNNIKKNRKCLSLENDLDNMDRGTIKIKYKNKYINKIYKSLKKKKQNYDNSLLKINNGEIFIVSNTKDLNEIEQNINNSDKNENIQLQTISNNLSNKDINGNKKNRNNSYKNENKQIQKNCFNHNIKTINEIHNNGNTSNKDEKKQIQRFGNNPNMKEINQIQKKNSNSNILKKNNDIIPIKKENDILEKMLIKNDKKNRTLKYINKKLSKEDWINFNIKNNQTIK